MKPDSQRAEHVFATDVNEIAADWHTRLTDEEPSADERAEFEAWIQIDPAHLEAYRRIERVYATLSSASADERVLELRREALSSTQSRMRLRWYVAASLGVFVMAGVIGASGSRVTDIWRQSAAMLSGKAADGGSFRTAVGESSSVTLSDGSTVSLNTNTRVDISFSTQERHVRLMSGQAWFQVARDPARPFVVEAADQRVTALGTSFDVRLDEWNKVQVTLTEGKVIVEPARTLLAAIVHARRQVAELAPGESVTATDQVLGSKTAADLSKISSWRQGKVVFDNDTLEAAVREINRYCSDRIELADASLAALRVSGVFKAGSNESFLQTVTAHYPIEISERTREKVVLRTKAED